MSYSSQFQRRIPEIAVHEAVLAGSPAAKTILVNGETGENYSFSDVEHRMQAIASALTRLGIKKGDVVAFIVPNSIQFGIGILACFSIGAIVTTANHNYKQYEIEHYLSDCRPQAIFTTVSSLKAVKDVLETLQYETIRPHLITMDTNVEGMQEFGDLLKDDGLAFKKDVVFDVKNDVACILYSSGTTGKPKGVMLTHYNITAALMARRDDPFKLPFEMRTLVVLPMFHVFGLYQYLFGLSQQGQVVILPRFKPYTFLKAIHDYKISTLYVVPTMIDFLIKSPLVDKFDLSSLTQVLCGGTSLSKHIETMLHQRLKTNIICQAYGSTEFVVLTCAPCGKHVPGSCGILLPNVTIKIVGVDTRTALERGQEGEILVQAPSVMKGYYKNDLASVSSFDNEWLVTGDIGYINADGYLFITGREKELIKHKGFQVAPAELEEVLLTHPAVSDVAVIGIPHQQAGQVIRAYVVKAPDQNTTSDEIVSYIEDRLVNYKWLTGGVQFVDSIPRSSTGKILRKDVQKC